MQQPISVNGLKSWLELQDGATEYVYRSLQDCLLCRYFKIIGISVLLMGSRTWCDKDYRNHKLPHALNNISLVAPNTYAAALERCNEFLAEQNHEESPDGLSFHPGIGADCRPVVALERLGSMSPVA